MTSELPINPKPKKKTHLRSRKHEISAKLTNKSLIFSALNLIGSCTIFKAVSAFFLCSTCAHLRAN